MKPMKPMKSTNAVNAVNAMETDRPRSLGSPRRDWALAAGLIAGTTADALLGDPRRGHPVALFGRAVTALEQAVYADDRPRGAAFTAASVALATAPLVAAMRLGLRWRPATDAAGKAVQAPTARKTGPVARIALTGATTWAVTGARSMTAEAARIGRALESGDLDDARRMLPSLCGRDPQHLDKAGLARAVVESVAENTSDAIVAPLIWGALAGPAGLAGYRAVNTLDAMVGHHSPRYERFGWASARLDDVANWGPARVTALLAAACAPIVGGRPANAWRTASEYADRHPSPNAGWCEAAFAGALGVRLGGRLSYAGRVEDRPELGTGRRPEPADIPRAVRLCRAVAGAAAALSAALALVPGGAT
jgi:adenosylcobinamide-phosphate synthase